MAKGNKTGGRKAGTPNKLTKDVRAAIVNAFFAGGGEDYLRTLMVTDAKAFCTLLGKAVPVAVGGDPDNPINVIVSIDRPPNETREEWLARRAREIATVGTAAGSANGRDHS